MRVWCCCLVGWGGVEGVLQCVHHGGKDNHDHKHHRQLLLKARRARLGRCRGSWSSHHCSARRRSGCRRNVCRCSRRPDTRSGNRGHSCCRGGDGGAWVTGNGRDRHGRGVGRGDGRRRSGNGNGGGDVGHIGIKTLGG
ncbi:hypothetical protein EDD21DRAFT_366913 [Dissophora ornata]|nr:hypothetical protein EDD21DRAFT_366913 [Dissophora ornata]